MGVDLVRRFPQSISSFGLMKGISEEIFSAGMVHVKGVLDKNDLAVLREALLTLYGQFDDLPSNIKTKSDQDAVGEIREIAGLSTRFSTFGRSSIFRTCKSLANEIFKTNCRYGHDEAIFKSAGSKSVDWHQDQSYSKFDKDKQCVSIWIPMQPTGPANGGMEYVVDVEQEFDKGSGSKSLLEHKRVSPESFMYHISTEDLPDARVVSPEMELGDVCVHTPLCIHRSHPNTSNELRVAWILQFNKYGVSRFVRWNNLKQYIPGL